MTSVGSVAAPLGNDSPDSLLASGATDPGKQREVNEDRYHCNPAAGLFMVIDGVGGQAAGGRAADVALDILRQRLVRQAGSVSESIRNAITAANNEIYRLAATRPEWEGMACVLTLVVVRNGVATYGHVGDSRLYKLHRDSIEKLTRVNLSRSLLQHNKEFYGYIRLGVPVEWRDQRGETQRERAQVIDFRRPLNNRFLAAREIKIQGVRVPHYNRRADLVCFVNGLPLVFIELKAVYLNIRAGFDGNLRDYMDENVISHAFHHNAFLIVSNGERARYGSITSQWEHFYEWKRQDEADKGKVDAEILLDGMLAHDRLIDITENFVLFDESKPGATRKSIHTANFQTVAGPVEITITGLGRQENPVIIEDKEIGAWRLN